MGLIFENCIYINGKPSTGGGGSEDLTQYEKICDRILGSEETYTNNKNNVISLSEFCNEIIGKNNTSSVYEEIELDTLKEIELVADDIIGE